MKKKGKRSKKRPGSTIRLDGTTQNINTPPNNNNFNSSNGIIDEIKAKNTQNALTEKERK